MKNKSTFLLFFAALILYYSFSSNPPNGRTGAPGESTCAACHSPQNPSFQGNIEISGITENIEPGITYSIHILVQDENMNASEAGFQLTNVGPDNSTTIGTFSNPSGNAKISVDGARTYFEHDNPTDFSSDVAVYTVDWTAPADLQSGDQVDFYSAAVVADGNGGNSNDLVVTSVLNTSYVIPPDELIVNVENITGPVCFNDPSGSASVSVEGGEPPYIIVWSNGETGSNASMLSPGSNNVLVTDAFNSSVSTDFTVENGEEIIDNLALIEHVVCLGDSTGSLVVEPTGGNGNLEILWSTNDISNGIFNLPAGEYGLTITDEEQCTAEFSYEIEDLGVEVSVSIDPNSIICFADSGNIHLETDAVDPSYLWSNGSTKASLINVPAADYTVTVFDKNECSAETSYINPYSAEMQLVLETENPDNSTIITSDVVNGIEPYSYLWNTGETADSLEITEAGSYILTVTDNNGCFVIDSLTIEDSCAYEIILNITNPTCPGAEDGEIMVEINFESDDLTSVVWNTGDSTSHLTMLEAGEYSAVFTNGTCMDSFKILLEDPDSLELEYVIEHPTQGFPNSGSISVVNVPDSIQAEYFWSTSAMDSSIMDLSEGTYYLTVTYNEECEMVDSFELQEVPCQLEAMIEIDTSMCFNELSSASVSHNSALGLNPKINWSTGDTTEMVSELTPGEYSVIVSDDSNCQDTVIFSIPSSDTIQITVDSISQISCEDSLGIIIINVDWEAEPYTIKWSNGDSGLQADSLEEGSISVEIINQKGCIVHDTFEIQREETGDPSSTFEKLVVYLDETGTYEDIPALMSSFIGSCQDSLYLILDTLQTDCSFVNDSIPYEFYFANHDEIIDTIITHAMVIDTIAPVAPAEIKLDPETFCEGEESTFLDTLSIEELGIYDNCALANNEDFIFNFSADSTSFLCDTITISDLSNNTTQMIVCKEFEVLSSPKVDYELTHVSCFGEMDGCINYDIYDGTPPYNVSVDSFCMLAAGEYSIEFSDKNNCKEELVFTITEPDELIINEVEKQDETPGESDGFIDIEITGGTAPYEYIWTENGVQVSNLQDLINFPSSQYRLTVIDNNGCTKMLNTYIDVLSSTTSVNWQEIRIRQNPVLDLLKLENIPQNASLKIYGSQGQLMHSQLGIQTKNIDLDVQEWSSSLYYCVIELEGKRKVMKFIKG